MSITTVQPGGTFLKYVSKSRGNKISLLLQLYVGCLHAFCKLSRQNLIFSFLLENAFLVIYKLNDKK